MALELVAGYSPIVKSVAELVPVVCKTSTEAKSFPVVSVWKSMNSFVVVVWKASVDEPIWASKPISFVEVWIWPKSSVVVGIASTDVVLAPVEDETGYSP